MGGERTTVQFGSLYSEVSRNGLTKSKKVRGTGVKFINMGEIFAHDRLRDVEADLAPLSAKELETSLLEPGDLLFARQSLVLSGAGKCSIFLGDDGPVSFESHLIRVRLDRDSALPEFYYYFFRSPSGKAAIYSIVEQGAGASGIRGSDLAKIPVIRPPTSDQCAVAHILGSLDDKIELNRQMNRTLEQIAQALFKSWFIDFDPVVYNAVQAGNPVPERFQATAERYRRNPKIQTLPQHILDLFPDHFEDSELGEIPVGWETGTVSDVAKVTSGKRPQKRSKEKTVEFNIPLYGGGGIMAYTRDPMLTQPLLLTGRVGTLGKVFRITEPCWPSDNTLLIFPTDHRYMEYLFFNLQRINFSSLNRGSTQPLLSQTDLKNSSLALPNESIISIFWEHVNSSFEKIDENIMEANSLVTMRDYLLPKLVSGGLRIPESEKEVEVKV